MFSDSDPITGGDRVFLEKVPGARGLGHPRLVGAGHFLQEDRPQQLAEIVTRVVAGAP